MPTPAKRLFPMLSVVHLDRSLAFYADLLGGKEEYRFPPQGEAVFVSLRVGDGQIGLGRITGDPALHGQSLRPATGHRIELCVYVEDLDATMSRMREAAVPVLLEPTAQPWGERVAYVADPDGNMVMLVQ